VGLGVGHPTCELAGPTAATVKINMTTNVLVFFIFPPWRVLNPVMAVSRACKEVFSPWAWTS
jgi:hypothetical protein